MHGVIFSVPRDSTANGHTTSAWYSKQRRAEQLDEVVEDTIRQVLKGGPAAVSHCKQLVFEIAGHNADTQKITDEHDCQTDCQLAGFPRGTGRPGCFPREAKT